MKPKLEPPTDASALTGLRFDPEAVLLNSPGGLTDPRFVGPLHAELEAELGPQEAAIALLQIGCLHGLRDALRAVDGAFAAGRREAGPSLPAALDMRFRTRRCEQRGALEVHGTWPGREEASARLAALGPGSEATCFLSAGYTSGWLSGTFDADLLVMEASCRARGDEHCHFVAREPEAWRASGHATATALLDALPFGTLRGLARNDVDRDDPPASDDLIDPDAAVIHIWGPVMVIPFGGSEEALRAVELIGRDPGARDVSVVVVDLTGAIVDEAFGAVALEQIVETIELWGAEAIFAGVSPLSKAVIAGLDRQPLVIHKDLEAAVAGAFRVAESQRRVV